MFIVNNQNSSQRNNSLINLIYFSLIYRSKSIYQKLSSIITQFRLVWVFIGENHTNRNASTKARFYRALKIMWFMFNDNNHQFIIIDMYTSFSCSGRDCTVRGTNGNSQKSIERSAFNRWVSLLWHFSIKIWDRKILKICRLSTDEN